uniref:Uncharacterized protein n=1 Tax=Lactuca sativa TaxID=4236 RepID=A0A9R1WFP6_LACSA|nr:hypothetical protein LSAT_V11C100038710 [Lactuca sativa]
MLAIVIPNLHRDLELITTFDIIEHLKEVFALHDITIEEIRNVSTHILKMKSHLDRLEILGSPNPQDLATKIIPNSLPKSYDTFIMNYNMNKWEKPISDLHLII